MTPEYKAAQDAQNRDARNALDRMPMGAGPAHLAVNTHQNELLLIPTLRRIRACEGEVAAQLLLEKIIEQRVLAERERCARICETHAHTDEEHARTGASFAAAIRDPAQYDPPRPREGPAPDYSGLAWPTS